MRETLASTMAGSFCGDRLTDGDAAMADAEAVAKLLSIDLDALIEQAVREIPEPKSWAFLNADGTPKEGARAKADDDEADDEDEHKAAE